MPNELETNVLETPKVNTDSDSFNKLVQDAQQLLAKPEFSKQELSSFMLSPLTLKQTFDQARTNFDKDKNGVLTEAELKEASASTSKDMRIMSAAFLANFDGTKNFYDGNRHLYNSNPKLDGVSGGDVADIAFFGRPKDQVIADLWKEQQFQPIKDAERFLAKSHLGIPLGYSSGYVGIAMYEAGYGAMRCVAGAFGAAALLTGAVVGAYYGIDYLRTNHRVNSIYDQRKGQLDQLIKDMR